MTAWLADITFGMVLVVGCLGIFGFMLVAAWGDRNSARHPEGRAGMLRDSLLGIAPLAPMLAMISLGAFQTQLRDEAWWTPVLLGLAVAGAVASFAPPMRRARQRLEGLRRYPPQ